MEKNIRQNEILKFLDNRNFASISEIAEVVFRSEATVRRDIKSLSDKGVLKIVYGGVVKPEYALGPIPVDLRERENSEEKERVAKKASELICDNQTIILDASSTVRRICKYIKNRKNLTVITNNLRVCEELKNTSVKVLATGGLLLERRECFVGLFAEEFIKGIKADILFFSSQGISENGDITDSSEEEIAIRRVMIGASKRQYFLYDSRKANTDFPFKLCNKNDITDCIGK